MGSILGELRPRRARTIVTGPAFRTCVTGELCLYRDLSSSNRYYTCTNPSRSLVQAGHEVILQVERDDRCAALLRKRFPQASLTREVSDVKELPAETEILASSLNWPEQADDQLNDQVVGTPTAACFLRSYRDGTFAHFPSPRRPSCFLGSLRTSSNASAMGYSFNSRQGKDLYLRPPCPFHDSSIFPNLVLIISFQRLRASCKDVRFLCCVLFFGETAACRKSCKRT